MDSWYPSPLSAAEVEARRAAAEAGRFPPNGPDMAQYSPSVEYDLPQTHSRSRTHSSCGTPPAYPETRLTTLAGQGHSMPATSHHGNCSFSDQSVSVSSYPQQYISYQPPWKADHPIEPISQPSDFPLSFVTPSQDSNQSDVSWRKRPSLHALQFRPVTNSDFQPGYSPSSSSSSLQKHAQFNPTETRPGHPPGRYKFINQVFKPLYTSERENELENNHLYTQGDPKASHYVTSGSLRKVDFSKSSKPRFGSYDRPPTSAGKKPKRLNEKRFPCPDCGRMFARAFNMETHRKTHIGYRPHHCPQCQKSFSRRHDLHRHLAAVHDERPSTSRPRTINVNSADLDLRDTPKISECYQNWGFA